MSALGIAGMLNLEINGTIKKIIKLEVLHIENSYEQLLVLLSRLAEGESCGVHKALRV